MSLPTTNLRKKYRALALQKKLYQQVYGPKLLPTNFIVDGNALALGGFFNQRGNRRFPEHTADLLFSRLAAEERYRGKDRWVVTLKESHLRPDFLFNHLRRRFPTSSPEREKRWIKGIYDRGIATQRERSCQDGPHRLEGSSGDAETVRPKQPRQQRRRGRRRGCPSRSVAPAVQNGLFLDHERGRGQRPQPDSPEPMKGRLRRPSSADTSSVKKVRFLLRYLVRLQRRRGGKKIRSKRKTSSLPSPFLPSSLPSLPFFPLPSLPQLPENGGSRKGEAKRPEAQPPVAAESAFSFPATNLVEKLGSALPVLPEASSLPPLLTALGRGIRMVDLPPLPLRWSFHHQLSVSWRYPRRLFLSPRYLENFRQNLIQPRRWRSVNRAASEDSPSSSCPSGSLLVEGRGVNPNRFYRWKTQAKLLPHLLQRMALFPQLSTRMSSAMGHLLYRLPRSDRRLPSRSWRRSSLKSSSSVKTLIPTSTPLVGQKSSTKKPQTAGLRGERGGIFAIRRRRRRLSFRSRRSKGKKRRAPRSSEKTKETFSFSRQRRWTTLQSITDRPVSFYFTLLRRARVGGWKHFSKPSRRPTPLGFRPKGGQRSVAAEDRIASVFTPRKGHSPPTKGGTVHQKHQKAASRMPTVSKTHPITLARITAAAPRVHYRILQLTLTEMIQREEEVRAPAKVNSKRSPKAKAPEVETVLEQRDTRFLLVERRFRRVGYNAVLDDMVGLLTPSVKLMAQQVGHKSRRRMIYTPRVGTPLPERRRIVFRWLREFISKNSRYNHLRRNTLRKSASKRVWLHPRRADRLTDSLFPRLLAEGIGVMRGGEAILNKLNEFDNRIGRISPLRHFRWDTDDH